MTREQSAEVTVALMDVLKELDYSPRTYSGRGMYGSVCLGVDVPDPVQAMQEIAQAYGVTGKPELRASGELPPVKWDSMGREYIIYWPSLVNPVIPQEPCEECGEIELCQCSEVSK